MGAEASRAGAPVPRSPPGAPSRVDLRVSSCFPYLPPADQGDEQSCVAQAFGAALYCAQARAGDALRPDGPWEPDAGDLYRHALRESPDAARGVAFGSVLERVRELYGAGLRRHGVAIEDLPNSAEALRRCLREGAPVVAGYQVNAEIQRFHTSAASREAHGLLLPAFARSRRPLSAHAVLLVGYDDDVGCFIARNSWGEPWGAAGHFLVRYGDVEDEDFFTDLVRVGPSSARSS